jgi:hypothetical protein
MLRPEGRELRTSPGMISRLTRGEHDYMHEVVPIVPALGHTTLRAVSRLWTPERNSYKSIDTLCIAIDKAATHERSHPIETDLARLTIQALELEKQVLKEIGYKDGR